MGEAMNEAVNTDIFSVMTVPAESVAPETAIGVARAHWGITATATLLTGERDRNFRLRADDGAQYVLKFANPAEDPGVTDLQVQALLHVAAYDPGFPVPRMVPSLAGALEERTQDGHRVRLLSWLHGIPLHEARRSRTQRGNLGRELARLGLALRDFRHPSSRHELIWDLAHTLRLREVIGVITDAPTRRVLEAALDAFAREVQPVLGSLRRQVLYNDMNTGNTLIDAADHDRLGGIIDFGDLVETAVVIDAAVGATPQVAPDMGVTEAIAAFIGGFHAVRPLLAEEVALLPTLIAARFSMGLILQVWHRTTHPDNPHYRIVSVEEMARRCEIIAAAGSPATLAAVRTVCAT